jgi:hypothetical protein
MSCRRDLPTARSCRNCTAATGDEFKKFLVTIDKAVSTGRRLCNDHRRGTERRQQQPVIGNSPRSVQAVPPAAMSSGRVASLFW